MFHSTREYHDARHAWKRTLPALPFSEAQLLPDLPSPLLDDLDGVFNSKRGVFFSFGNCFYHHRQVKDEHGKALIGHAKVLVPHFGSLFTIVDDLQGILCGGSSLTKSFRMEVLSPTFVCSTAAAYSFLSTIEEKVTVGRDGKERVESHTRLELRDGGGQAVVRSSGLFVRNADTHKMLTGQYGMDIEASWKQTAPLRMAGDHPHDAKMAFVLVLPREDLAVPHVPSWWTDCSSAAPLRGGGGVANPFAGKFELYHVQVTGGGSGVRAVARPGLTAEGPPTIVHGGCGASMCIQVLMNLRPQLRLKTHQVQFKRRIPLESNVVIEWKQQHNAPHTWDGVILSWEREVLQQVVLTEHPDDDDDDAPAAKL